MQSKSAAGNTPIMDTIELSQLNPWIGETIMNKKLTAIFAVASIAGALIAASVAQASDSGGFRYIQKNHGVNNLDANYYGAQNRDYKYGGARDWSCQAYKKPSRSKVLKKKIDRRLKNITLPLRRIFDLGRDYKGYRIDAVMVKLGAKKRRGRVKLRVNGHVVDRKNVGDGRVLWLRPGSANVIGQGLNSLQLEIDGKMYVRDVKVKMTRLSNRRHSAVGYRYTPAATELGSREAESIAQLILRQILRAQ
ncbi:MAG: hypothetical protein ACJAU6_001119 [Alphaproteobacteria bacterium]|jgi:hypothetical protein